MLFVLLAACAEKECAHEMEGANCKNCEYVDVELQQFMIGKEAYNHLWLVNYASGNVAEAVYNAWAFDDEWYDAGVLSRYSAILAAKKPLLYE